MVNQGKPAKGIYPLIYEFERLRLWAIELNSKFDSTDEIEPALFELVMLMKNNPNHMDYFVEQFKRLVRLELAGPGELVPYCMRVLRYPEVQAEANAYYRQLMDTASHIRYMNYLSDINIAYEETEWPDADLFPLYREHFER